MKLDIQTGLSAVLESRKKQYPLYVNRISALDDPCLRKLYYMRHDWKQATPTDNGLQGLFETGTILEPVIMRIASEVGMASTPHWRIVGAQMPTDDALLKKYQISGTIDGMLQVQLEDGKWETLGVVDIKTMSPNIFPRVLTYADLTRYPWTSKYRGQLMLYSLAHNLSRCFLLLVNKSNLFNMRLLSFDVDMGYCEELLQKAQAINDALGMGVAPEGANSAEVCPRCQFYSFCMPNLTLGGELTISESVELEDILDKLDELKPTATEFESLKKRRDKMLPKGENVACGRWLVTWKKIVVEYAAKPSSRREQWQKKIVKAPSISPGRKKEQTDADE